MRRFFKGRSSTPSSVKTLEETPEVPSSPISVETMIQKPRMSNASASARVPPPAVRSSMLATPRKRPSTPVLYISSPIVELTPFEEVESERLAQPETLGLLGDFRSSIIMASLHFYSSWIATYLQNWQADLGKRFSLLRNDGVQHGAASRSSTLEGVHELYEPASQILPPFKQRRPSPPLRTGCSLRADRERRALPQVPPSPVPSFNTSESSSMTVTPSSSSACKPFAIDPPPFALATPRPRPQGLTLSRPLSYRNSHRLSSGTRTISNFRRGGTGVSSLFGGRVEELALAKGARARATRSSKTSRAGARADLLYSEEDFPLESSERDSGLYVDALENAAWSDPVGTRRASAPARRARPKHVVISFVPFRAESPRTSVVEIEPPRRPSCVSFKSDTFGASQRTRMMSWEQEAPSYGPTDMVADAPAQRAFDSDPYAFLSALLPPLHTIAPDDPSYDYPFSVSTPSSPVGRSSRHPSTDSNAFSQYDWKRSGSISTVAMESPLITASEPAVETYADGDVIWRLVADLRSKRVSSKTADSIDTLISSDPRDGELPHPPSNSGKTEPWPCLKRPSRVVVVDDTDPWGGALAAVAPRRLRAARP